MMQKTRYLSIALTYLETNLPSNSSVG